MKVKDIIEVLRNCNPDADVVVIEDGDRLDDYQDTINVFEVSNSKNNSDINNVYISAN